jgi:hypothetical protein
MELAAFVSVTVAVASVVLYALASLIDRSTDA